MSVSARACRILTALLLLGLLAPVVEAAGPTLTVQQVDTSQFPKVRTSVDVVNAQSVPIASLDNQAFDLFEDDKKVDNFQVESIIGKEPIAVALIIDTSGSMADAGKLDAAKLSASAFVDAMGPDDSMAIVSFADTVNIIPPGYSRDKAALKGAIGKLAAKGDTSLYDAVYQTTLLQGALSQHRKVLLVLTDGEDTKSKQSLDAAISAATAVGSPVMAIGLGSDVKKDVLDKLASSTSGQAMYVSSGDQLNAAFKQVSDQLRLLYVLTYTSKLTGDGKAHTVDIKSRDPIAGGEAKGSFTLNRTALTMDVKGLVDASQVSGTQRVEVTITAGVAKQVDLIVDDQTRDTKTAAPFAFQWDTSKEKPGPRIVVVRATDATGAPTDAKFVIEVIGPTPVPRPTVTPTTVLPTAVPTTVAPTPAPTPTPVPTGGTDPLLYVGVGVLALAVVGGGIAGGVLLSRRKPPAQMAPVTPAPRVDDRTDPMGLPPIPVDVTAAAGAAAGSTIVSGVPRPPRARLRIVHQGAEREVLIDQPEVILGRESTNPIAIKDPLASRRHARISVENGEYWVEDLKSLNGTRVNGELITRQKLAPNDQIKIGDAVITFTPEP